jgi:hypothetical protein
MYEIIKRGFVWNGDDIYYHFRRIMDLHDNIHNDFMASNVSLSDFGQIGYGLNIFYPWVTLLPFELFFKLSGNYINSYYYGLLFYFFISFLVSHYSMKEFSHSNKLAIIFSLVYNFGTYRLVELLPRSAVAEYVASIFLPLCFLGFYEVLFGDSKKWHSLAIGMSLIIFSHVLTTFMCVLMFLLILILFSFKLHITKNRLLNLVKAVAGTILSTLVFTIPFLSEETFQNYGVPDPQILEGQDISKLLIFGIDNSSKRMAEGSIYSIGTILVLGLLIGAILLKKFDAKYKGVYLLFLMTFVLSSNLFPWRFLQHTPIQVIQFPFRILMFTTLFGSIIVAKSVEIIFDSSFDKNFLVVLLPAIVIMGGLWASSILNTTEHSLVSKKEFVISNEMIKKNAIPETYLNQYVPARTQKYLPDILNHEVKINGHESFQSPRVIGFANEFKLGNIKKGDRIDLPYIDYKYTRAFLNGRKLNIIKNDKGIVEFESPVSTNYAKIDLTYDSKMSVSLYLISIFSLLTILLLDIYPRFKVNV